MRIRVERCLTCGNNPAGITINYGWYALAECVYVGTAIGTALYRWCGLHQHPKRKNKSYTPQKPGQPNKTDRIIKLYHRNPKLRNKDIAERVGCTKEMVSKVLTKMGIRRNRWDGYVSKDPRYSQNKRRALQNEHF